MKKIVFNSRFLCIVLLLLVGLDLFFVSSSPSYKYYKQQSAKLEERLKRWENTFKKDYIDSINKVAAAISSNSVTNLSRSGQGIKSTSPSDVSPILKPLDITRADFRYFEANGVRGFSLSGRLVFKVGDLFLGRQIVSVDRFGAALSDGGLVRSGLSDRSEQNKKGDTK